MGRYHAAMTRGPRWLRVVSAASVAALWLSPPTDAAAQQALKPLLEGEALIAALRDGGLVVLMRHTSTDSYVPGVGDHDISDCTTQRNLDDRGREEAKAVGKAIVTLGIPVGPILSSPYCRCVETGELAFGGVVPVPELAVFDQLSAPEKDARATQIRNMLNDKPEAGHNTVLITHTGTLLYTFGLQIRPEGIAHVFRPAEFGNAIYLGRVLPEEWAQFAAASNSPKSAP